MFSITSSRITPAAQLSTQARAEPHGTVQIAVAGEIDHAGTGALHTGLLHVLATWLPQHLEVDLDKVTFMDCGELSVLIAVRQAAARTGCRLQITNPQPPLRRMLQLTGLLGILIPDPTEHLRVPTPAGPRT